MPAQVLPLHIYHYARANRPDLWPIIEQKLRDGEFVLGPAGGFDYIWKAFGDERPGHKYIRKIPTGDPNRPWDYVYPDDLPKGQMTFDFSAHAPKQLSLFTIPQPKKKEPRPKREKAEPEVGPDLLSWSAPPPVLPAKPKPTPEPKPNPTITRQRRNRPFGAQPGDTPKMRVAANRRALELVEKSRKEPLTQDELDEIARYSGNGGADVGTSLNQYFTRPDIAAAIWKRATRILGSTPATALEPACGAGVFVETAPDGVAMTGVELDPEVASVAKTLHPEAEIVTSAFEEFAVRNEGARTFDVVISNAPFCTRNGASQRIHKSDVSSADEYFLDTALDQCRTGGVVAMIVHRGVLSSSARGEFRRRLLARGELVDAYRLPGEAFGHTHTSVTSDVLFIRKRDPAVAAALLSSSDQLMQSVGAWNDAFVNGSFFDSHPERLIGTPGVDWQGQPIATGDADAVAPTIGKPPPLPTRTLTLDDLRKSASAEDTAKIDSAEARASTEPTRLGATKVVQGTTYIMSGDPPRWHRLDEVDVEAVLGHTPSDALREARELADSIKRLKSASERSDSYSARALRREIVPKVRKWVEGFGLPAEHVEIQKLTRTVPELLYLVGAVRPDGTLSDLLLHDPPAAVPKTIDRANLGAVVEALAAGSNGYIDLAHVREQWTEHGGASDAELRRRVIELDTVALEGDRLRHIEDYCTGKIFNTRDELRALLAAHPDHADGAKLRWQQERVEAVIASRWRTLDNVEIDLRSGWLPIDYLSAWLTARHQRLTGNKDATAVATYQDAWYSVTRTNGSHVYVDSGGEGEGRASSLVRYLNRDRLSEREREEVDALREAFQEFVRAHGDRAQIEEVYNRTFFGDVRREFASAPFHLDGLNPDVKVNPYINASVRWSQENGKGITALDVGLGKTFNGILLALAEQAAGRARRPFVIVPKSVATNWQKEIERIKPGAKVLVIGEHSKVVTSGARKGQTITESDTDDERNAKLALAAQNQYDIILVTRPAFDRIPVREETISDWEAQDFWRRRESKMEGASEKAQKKAREKESSNRAKLAQRFTKDVVYWDDIGVDFLMADEAHAYKNLYTAKDRFGQSPKFLGGGGQSKQAQDMAVKAHVVRSRTDDGRGVYFLTATPVKNSPIELYNMLSFIAPKEWENRGIRNSEEFIDRYCVIEQRQCLSTKGTIEEAPCVVGFKNLTELHGIMDNYMLARNAKDVGLKIPKAVEFTQFVDLTPEQLEVYSDLRAEAEAMKNGTGQGNMLGLLDKMRKAAIDLEIYDPVTYAGWHKKSPKYKAAVENCVKGAADGGQIVFIDSNDSHERLKGMLVEAGFKPEEVAIVNAKTAPDSDSRYEIGEAFNRGDVKVVIGNTATMGEGINLQRKASDVHHLDIPWEPGAIIQRNGRGVRQGNQREDVRVHTYLGKRSFDGYRWNTLKGKEGWLEKFKAGADSVENDEASALGGDDMLVMLADDPVAARAKMDADVEKKKEEWRLRHAAALARKVGEICSLRDRLRKLGDAPGATAVKERIGWLAKRLLEDTALPESFKEIVSNDKAIAVVRSDGAVYAPGMVLKTEWGSQHIVEAVTPGTRMIRLRQLDPAHGDGLQEPQHVEKVERYSPTGKTVGDLATERLNKTAAITTWWEKRNGVLGAVEKLKSPTRTRRATIDWMRDTLPEILTRAGTPEDKRAGVPVEQQLVPIRRKGAVEFVSPADLQDNDAPILDMSTAIKEISDAVFAEAPPKPKPTYTYGAYYGGRAHDFSASPKFRVLKELYGEDAYRLLAAEGDRR